MAAARGVTDSIIGSRQTLVCVLGFWHGFFAMSKKRSLGLVSRRLAGRVTVRECAPVRVDGIYRRVLWRRIRSYPPYPTARQSDTEAPKGGVRCAGPPFSFWQEGAIPAQVKCRAPLSCGTVLVASWSLSAGAQCLGVRRRRQFESCVTRARGGADRTSGLSKHRDFRVGTRCALWRGRTLPSGIPRARWPTHSFMPFHHSPVPGHRLPPSRTLAAPLRSRTFLLFLAAAHLRLLAAPAAALPHPSLRPSSLAAGVELRST